LTRGATAREIIYTGGFIMIELSSDRKKKLTVIVLAVLLCASLTLNVVQYCFLTADSHQRIVGTYMTGAQSEFPSADDEYLIFLSDDTYMRYRQFQIFEEGTYQVDADRVVELVSQDRKNTTHAVWKGEQLYYFESDNGRYLFEKISDMPTMINVNKELTD
jgi:hypothetical protein